MDPTVFPAIAYSVTFDPGRLVEHDLSIADVSTMLANANVLAATGRVEDRSRLYLVVVDAQLRSIDDLRALPVKAGADGVVTLGDVADVRLASAPRVSHSTADGRECVLINIYQQPGGNTVQVAAGTRAALDGETKRLPADVNVSCWYGQSDLINGSASGARDAVLIGGYVAYAHVQSGLMPVMDEGGFVTGRTRGRHPNIGPVRAPRRRAGRSLALARLGGLELGGGRADLGEDLLQVDRRLLLRRGPLYSVDPHATSPSLRKSTWAVLPFSKHGVMRATKVSPFMNFMPEPCARRSHVSGTWPSVGMFVMSRYGASAPVASRRGGLTSNASDSGFTSHPSGTGPRGESVKRSGRAAKVSAGTPGKAVAPPALALVGAKSTNHALNTTRANPSNFAPVRRFCSILSSSRSKSPAMLLCSSSVSCASSISATWSNVICGNVPDRDSARCWSQPVILALVRK